MAKIRVSTILDSVQNGITRYSGSGILKNNEIVFYENDVKVIIIFFDNSLHLKRIHNNYTIELLFENSLTKDGIYDIKCDSMQIPVKTSTSVFDIKDGSMHIEYELELGGLNQGNFVYDVNYEVIK